MENLSPDIFLLHKYRPWTLSFFPDDRFTEAVDMSVSFQIMPYFYERYRIDHTRAHTEDGTQMKD